jgi:hypothetical protein
MTAFAPTLPGCDGQWVDDWLSPDRLTTYLAVAGGSRPKALALYEWNIQAASAIQQDLCHLEIGLRNAYDAAFRAHWTDPTDWTSDPAGVFPPKRSTRGGKGTTNPKARIDVNAKPLALLIKARQDAGGAAAPPAKWSPNSAPASGATCRSSATRRLYGRPTCITHFLPVRTEPATSMAESTGCTTSATGSPTTSRYSG